MFWGKSDSGRREGEDGGCKKRCSLYTVENSENVQLSERTEMVHADDNKDGTEELRAVRAELCVGQEGK